VVHGAVALRPGCGVRSGVGPAVARLRSACGAVERRHQTARQPPERERRSSEHPFIPTGGDIAETHCGWQLARGVHAPMSLHRRSLAVHDVCRPLWMALGGLAAASTTHRTAKRRPAAGMEQPRDVSCMLLVVRSERLAARDHCTFVGAGGFMRCMHHHSGTVCVGHPTHSTAPLGCAAAALTR